MDYQTYHTYLASREWALKREAIRQRSGNICERCHRAPHQETHHLTYARLGHELLEDLLGVCSPCHKFLAGKTDSDPVKQLSPSLTERQISGELTLEEYWAEVYR